MSPRDGRTIKPGRVEAQDVREQGHRTGYHHRAHHEATRAALGLVAADRMRNPDRLPRVTLPRGWQRPRCHGTARACADDLAADEHHGRALAITAALGSLRAAIE